MVQGTITADVLTSKSAVPQREYDQQKGRTGYQRPLAMARVNRLISDLVEGRVDLPTAVLLNLREYDPDEDFKARNGMKFFYPRSPLYVVDGQHPGLRDVQR